MLIWYALTVWTIQVSSNTRLNIILPCRSIPQLQLNRAILLSHNQCFHSLQLKLFSINSLMLMALHSIKRLYLNLQMVLILKYWVIFITHSNTYQTKYQLCNNNSNNSMLLLKILRLTCRICFLISLITLAQSFINTITLCNSSFSNNSLLNIKLNMLNINSLLLQTNRLFKIKIHSFMIKSGTLLILVFLLLKPLLHKL